MERKAETAKDPAIPAEFNPAHTIRLDTNHLPKGPVEEFAFWERVQIVPLEPWARLSGMREKGGDVA